VRTPNSRRQPIVRLRPAVFVPIVGILLAVGAFYIAVIGADDRYALGFLSGTGALVLAWLDVVFMAALAVDLLFRDFCLVSEEDTTVVVHLPLGLDRLVDGYRFDASSYPNLRVRLTESESDSRIRAKVMSNEQVLRSLSMPAMQLDTATRQRCNLDAASRP
jgi:hypothetical protein